MTIAKKLYLNFGLILGIVVLLFMVNVVAIQREHSARNATVASTELAQLNENIRFQMMENRLNLRNYLLSGDSREVQKVNDGVAKLNESIKQAESKATYDSIRSPLGKLRESEANW